MQNYPTSCGAVLVAIAGDLDLATAPNLRQQLRRAVDQGPTGLVVDMVAVSFCGAAGLRALHVACRYATQQGKTFRVRRVQPPVRRIIALVGMAEMLEECPLQRPFNCQVGTVELDGLRVDDRSL